MKLTKKKVFQVLIIATLFAEMYTLILGRWLDNDIYFMLSMGRYIEKNGVPTINPFFLGHEIKTLVPQWLYDVIVFEIQDKIGYVGIFVTIFVILLIGIFFLYKTARLHNVDPFVAMLLVAAYFYINTGIINIRANLLSAVLCIIQLYLMERYAKNSKIRFLIPLPIISLLEINLHCSIWPMHLCIMAAYICPQFRLPLKIKRHDYKLKPLIYTTAIMFEAGLANPYGFDAMMFLRDGISEETKMLIAEMGAASMDSGELVGMLICAGVLLHLLTKRETYYQYFYLFLGWFILGTQYSRNFVWGYLGILMLAFQMLHDTDFSKTYEKVTPKKWVGFLPFVLFFAVILLCKPKMKMPGDEDMSTPYGAIEYIQAHSPEGAAVLTEYNDGGFFQWYGYKTFLDPRADGYMPGYTGGYDIIHEYLQAIYLGDWNTMETIIEKYDFDYAYVYSSTKWEHYFAQSDEYECVYECQRKKDAVGRDVAKTDTIRGKLYMRIRK